MKKYIRVEVLKSIAEIVKKDGLRSTARAVGIDPGYLSRALAGKAPFSDESAAKFGFKRMETQYMRVTNGGK